jgi:endonuclease/exonuclease/phosphatase family metal-dependent hydrolase
MLRVMTYNILTGGADGDGMARLPILHQIVAEVEPNILALQEANEFEIDRHQRMFEFGAATGTHGLLGLSGSGFHGALFLRPPLEVIGVETVDPGANRSVIGVEVGESGGVDLHVRAIHLHPRRPEVRFSGAMAVLAGLPDLVMGDFNSRMGVPAGGSGSAGPDDRIFAALQSAGYVDLFGLFHPGEGAATFRGAGGYRLDYIFASAELSAHAISCEILRTELAERASDHYPVVAEFDLDRGDSDS